jgi:hypothetical protein
LFCTKQSWNVIAFLEHTKGVTERESPLESIQLFVGKQSESWDSKLPSALEPARLFKAALLTLSSFRYKCIKLARNE